MIQDLSNMQSFAQTFDESGVRLHYIVAFHSASLACSSCTSTHPSSVTENLELSVCLLPETGQVLKAAHVSSCPFAGVAIPAAHEGAPLDASSAGNIQQQQHAGSGFAATTSALQDATSAASVAAPVLQQAALLAWAGLEGGLDMCGAALQSAPVVGRLAGLPDAASSGPSRPVRLLRWGIAGVYGTAGALKGIRDGIVQLRKQH